MDYKFRWDDTYGRNYFENGPVSGQSLYQNYRWMPEVSFPMACKIKELFPESTVLDFGCAKGYLVHALRTLGVIAYGFDVSVYAYDTAHPLAKPYFFTPDTIDDLKQIDVVFAKDVLEHIGEKKLSPILKAIAKICTHAFFIVPFGDKGSYRIKQYNLDPSHVIIEPEGFWEKQFESAGFKIKRFTYDLYPFKINWSHHKNANGFFCLKSVIE